MLGQVIARGTSLPFSWTLQCSNIYVTSHMVRCFLAPCREIEIYVTRMRLLDFHSSGLDAYRAGFELFRVVDLYQNPAHRPRGGSNHMPALTRGCKRLFVDSAGRYLHGLELCLTQGLPVTYEAAERMHCAQIKVGGLSHNSLCSLAGNSMHSACIGLVCLFLLCVEPKLT